MNVYPDPDWPLLSAALSGVNVDTVLISWDATGLDWRRFDLVVVKSTWDSVDRPQDYLRWARHVARATTLVNPVRAIEWNVDKSYLRFLASRGVRTVPTEWVIDAERWEPPAYEFVVKPTVSAGGRQSARYQPSQPDAALAHVRGLCAASQTVMVQPYVTSVEADGESKLVFIEGRFSHAVRVGQLLAPGEGVIERPWERVVPQEAMVPTEAQLATAIGVLDAVGTAIACPLLYARVDLVTGPTGEHWLSEVELIDPVLFLRFSEPAARRYAQAIGTEAQRSVACLGGGPT